MIVFLARLASFISRTFNLGAGVTWTGEIALRLDPQIFPKLLPKGAKVILVAGTNGKTTTVKLLRHILGKRVIHNETGANVLNGLVGSLIVSKVKNPKYVVLETDEATLPLVLNQITPTVIILLNLFRDQLDRYGEVDMIATNWQKALSGKPKQGCTLVVNADDPHLAWIGKNTEQKVHFFGLNNKKYFLSQPPHATDSIFCPNCGTRMIFEGHYISHLGEYKCPKCDFVHPKDNLTATDAYSSLEGVYNIYNVLAATLTAKSLGIKANLEDFLPAFGRQEQIGNTKILLSKNPAGFNESIRTVLAACIRRRLIQPNSGEGILLVLNDRIPDGRDVSWIWDVDFEELKNYKEPIIVSGERTYDLALRLKYGGVETIVQPDLAKAIASSPTWILPTYSAMLEIRKIMTGKKIL